MNIRKGSALAAAALAAIALATTSTASSAAPTVADDSTGTYYQVAQQRLLDTRSGNGAPKATVGAGKSVDVQVTGRAAIPASGVAAVVLNLTAVAPTAGTYITAYPTGGARPNASSLNLPAGATRANLVTVPVGTGGKVTLFNAAGNVNLLADVLGFYSADDSLQATLGMGTQFQLSEPGRLFDSRQDGFPLSPGEVVPMGPDFGPDVNPTIKALAINVTALKGTKAGYIQVYPENVSTPPAASSLNFAAGQTVANMVIAPTSYNATAKIPAINVKNTSSGSTEVIVDVVGFYDQDATVGLRFHAIAPKRIIDTRTGTGGVKAPLAKNTTRKYTAPAAVAGADTFALVANTTAVAPTASTYLTVWDGSSSRPTISNLNAAAGQVVANATVAPLDDTNAFNVYNNAGSTNVIMDVTGSFEYHEAPAAAPSAAPQLRSMQVAPSSRMVTMHSAWVDRTGGSQR
jgi:hypothetical protein